MPCRHKQKVVICHDNSLTRNCEGALSVIVTSWVGSFSELRLFNFDFFAINSSNTHIYIVDFLPEIIVLLLADTPDLISVMFGLIFHSMPATFG